MKVSVIICAAGDGKRAGFGKNKLLAPLYGVPAILHTFRKFDIPEVNEVIVAAAKKDMKDISGLAAPFGYTVIQGGKTRTESVKHALKSVTGDIVLVHDGARPFVTRDLICDVIDSVKKYGSGVCAVHFTDTTVTVKNGAIRRRLNRDDLYTLQTPQGFQTDKLRKAYKMMQDGETFSDDSTLYAKYIEAPRIVEGDPENMKLTYKGDYLREMPPAVLPRDAHGDMRVGIGIDVHPFTEGDFVTLCGIKIASDGALDAHSDGDVVLHAVIDALFSAAGLKDIGSYFPSSEDIFRGADSTELLKKTLDIVRATGFAPENFSITIQAEQPRLAPHIDAMRERLAQLTATPLQNIAIAAGTCEGLGFVGQGLGIAAYCSVLVKRVNNK